MERAAVMCVVLVLLLFIIVGFIEYFIPLNAKFELNSTCRGTLMTIEQRGELSPSSKTDLENKLATLGFKNISINVTGGNAQGSSVTLEVKVDYQLSKLTNVLQRDLMTQPMAFKKTTTVRRVIN